MHRRPERPRPEGIVTRALANRRQRLVDAFHLGAAQRNAAASQFTPDLGARLWILDCVDIVVDRAKRFEPPRI